MSRFVRSVLLMCSVFCLGQSAFGLGGGGGMDSGGSDGLFYRLRDAVDKSLDVLAAVQPELVSQMPQDLAQFYLENRKALMVEAIKADVVVKPAAEVYIEINGRRIQKAMATRLEKGSPVFVSSGLSTSDPMELVADLLHEFGHHLGVPQENDVFLDRLAFSLVKRSLEINPSIKGPAPTCLWPEQVLQQLSGTWRGVVDAKFGSGWADEVEFNINEDGSYSDSSYCDPDKKRPFPSCASALYYGTNGKDPRKKIQISDTCGGFASAAVDYVSGSGPQSSSSRLEWRQIRVSADGEILSFELWWGNMYGPAIYLLKRVHKVENQ